MAVLVYSILSGDPNFTASIDPTVTSPNIHTEIGTYFFAGIPDGIYTLSVVDSNGCKNVQKVETVGYTTTTTSTTSSTTSTTTTTEYVLPPCKRPTNLSTFNLIRGYTTPSTGVSIDSTLSADYVCAAITYMNSFIDGYIDVIWNIFRIEATGLDLFAQCYLVNGTNDCSCPTDGWYFTESSAYSHITYHIVNCHIVEILSCDCLIDGGYAIQVDCGLEGYIINPIIGTTTTSTTTITTTTINPESVNYSFSISPHVPSMTITSIKINGSEILTTPVTSVAPQYGTMLPVSDATIVFTWGGTPTPEPDLYFWADGVVHHHAVYPGDYQTYTHIDISHSFIVAMAKYN